MYGNVDEVELVLNGKTIRRQTADKGPDSDYISVPNGGNGKNLHFPPFTFYGVPKERGAVRTYEQRTTIRYQVSEISAFYPDCW